MRTPSLILLLIATLISSVSAIQFRDNSGTNDNNRFVGSLGSPATLSANAAFLLNGFDTTGVGWFVQDTRRQFAMVSPQHFVCATHFRPAASGQVRFLGSDGVVYTHEILRTEIVRDSGGNTDLSLGTLETPVDTSVIKPFRYADLPSENSYAGTGFVFGRTAQAGLTTFQNVTNFTNPSLSASFNNTRYIVLAYNRTSGNSNDAFLEEGDSGSPSFLEINGELALVATNSLVAETSSVLFGFSSFLPFYVDEVNALMADEGFQLSSSSPSATTLSATQGVTTTLRAAFDGSLTFTVSNTGATRANNVEVRLSDFTAEPNLITGGDFFKRTEGNGDVLMSRAFLDPGESGEVVLNWSSLPSISSLLFDVEVGADEANDVLLEVSEDILPSFLGFVEGLSDQSPEGDDDGDEIANLLEFALAGDVNVSSTATSEGFSLGLSIKGTPEGLELSFLRRVDAAQLGLDYTLLSGTSFPLSTELDLSLAQTEAALEPGFEKVTLELDELSDSQIFSLGVTLNESL